MSLDVDKIRKDFPILQAEINGKPLAYLDSAATSQKPLVVIERIFDFYARHNANVARGLHKLSEQATLEYAEVRTKVKEFIGAENQKEVIFTRGTTESINLAMRGWGEKFVKKGDKIVVSIMEHHSNFVPWQELARRKRAKLEVIDIDENGELNLSDAQKKIKAAKIVAISGASNVLGTVNDLRAIGKMAHEQDALFVVDGAQLIPSRKIDVRKIDCDMLAFSGHKMLGPFGSGILYGKEETLEKMDPLMYGSEMIREVTIHKSTYAELPERLETGTPEVSAVLGLGTAIDYLNKIGMKNIEKYEQELIKYTMMRLSEIKGLKILGPYNENKRVSLASFTLEGVHPHDLAAILDEQGIAVRSGHHCAMPLHARLGVDASTRASFYLYNTKEEADKLVDGIEKAKKIFS
ncbi:cysteine desulfurase [Candidatus Micrarchaeota archaeon]|nr:cysteine desulfurase [Candidatus Micrarchaeota archaeon]